MKDLVIFKSPKLRESAGVSRWIRGAIYSPIPTEYTHNFTWTSWNLYPRFHPSHGISIEVASLRIFPRIALEAIWRQQCKPNYWCSSVGLRAKYCKRIVPVQISEKYLLATPVRRMIRLAAGHLYVAWQVFFTHTWWHPPVPLSILVGLHVYTHAGTHTSLFSLFGQWLPPIAFHLLGAFSGVLRLYLCTSF